MVRVLCRGEKILAALIIRELIITIQLEGALEMEISIRSWHGLITTVSSSLKTQAARVDKMGGPIDKDSDGVTFRQNIVTQ